MTPQSTQAKKLYLNYKTIFTKNGFSTNNRLACFMGQGWVESKLLPKRESFNYSVQGLLDNFSRSRISLDDAKKYGRTETRTANQEAIANLLYGGEWGKRNLGNTQVGDGFKYRGRGIFQITGRANYAKLTRDTGIDFLNNPDLLLEEANSIIGAIWYWKQRALDTYADKKDIVSISKIINLGNVKSSATPKHLQERIDFTNEFLTIFS